MSYKQLKETVAHVVQQVNGLVAENKTPWTSTQPVFPIHSVGHRVDAHGAAVLDETIAAQFKPLVFGLIKDHIMPSFVFDYLIFKRNQSWGNYFNAKFKETKTALVNSALGVVGIAPKVNSSDDRFITALISAFGTVIADNRWVNGPLETEKTGLYLEFYTFEMRALRRDVALDYARFLSRYHRRSKPG
jgi:hypothetical protein